VAHGLAQQEIAQRLAQGRAAGLARSRPRVAARAQRLDDPRGVRALARAVDAFQRDEASRHCARGAF
jgi:hypothetical protein